MRTLTLIKLLCFVITNCSIAQTIRYSASLPYIRLAAYSIKQNDPLSFTGNQAALAREKQPSISLFGENRFLLAANRYYNFATILPTQLGNIGVQFNYAGFKNFNENNIGLAYAKTLGSKIDLGVQFNYYSYHIPFYGAASSVNFDLGIILHFTDQLNGGIHIYNPFSTKLRKQATEKMASLYAFGLGYDASENFFISTEIIKEEDLSVNVVAGVQYQFANQFFLRTGFLSESSTVFGGIGAGWKKMRVDITASYHPQLGFSPGILFISYLGNKK